ncbi:MAG UNVERIFIED_CONTAM: HlyD family secretion protein [Rickettsiaceae bacterium]
MTYLQAKMNLEITTKNLNILNTEKLIKNAELTALRESYKSAQKALNDTIIKSPIDGVVASNSLRKGNIVRQGMPLLMIVPKTRYVKANFKETQVTKFEIGQDVEFEVDAIKGAKFKGKIKHIYPATGSKFSLIPADNATGNFTKIIQRIPVIIEFDNEQEKAYLIRTGMSTRVKVSNIDNEAIQNKRHPRGGPYA